MWLFVLLFSLLTQALHILDPLTCSIPYIVPLAFQRECDRTDEYFHTEMEVENLDGDPLDFEFPPDFATSSSLQRKPNVWTHEPFCLESEEAQNGYCVYTDANFASGRGLSVIAPPAMARQIALVPFIKDKAGSHAFSTLDGFHKFTRKAMDSGNGFYVVANASYVRGERMSSITPMITMTHMGNSLLKPEDQSLLLRVALGRSPKSLQDSYMGMYVTPGKDPWFDRLEKNSFSTTIGNDNLSFIAALPESAVFNHACRPNLGYHFNPKTLAHEMYVVRDIKPGEEITVSYIPPYDNSTIRAAKLKHIWDFSCTCPLCTSSPGRINASDRRLRTIERLVGELNVPYEERMPDVAKATRLVTLHEQEGLWGAVAGAYMYVAMEYMQLGDRIGALEWAMRARDGLKLWSGAGHPYYEGMVRMVAELEEVDKLDESAGLKWQDEWNRKVKSED